MIAKSNNGRKRRDNKGQHKCVTKADYDKVKNLAGRKEGSRFAVLLKENNEIISFNHQPTKAVMIVSQGDKGKSPMLNIDEMEVVPETRSGPQSQKPMHMQTPSTSGTKHESYEKNKTTPIVQRVRNPKGGKNPQFGNKKNIKPNAKKNFKKSFNAPVSKPTPLQMRLYPRS